VSVGTVYVWVDLSDGPVPVGTLWPHLPRTHGRREAASFEYASSWLAHPDRFALEPALSLGTGKFQTAAGKAAFGALGDSAPDRWGRMLIQRDMAQRAKGGGKPRTLFEVDYLLGVRDETRMGALRFRAQPDGPFLAESRNDGVPPMVELPALLRATESVLGDDLDPAALQLLLAPGSSLGGARLHSDRGSTCIIGRSNVCLGSPFFSRAASTAVGVSEFLSCQR
jgi:serine/threonine-protein kinase HipA